MDIPPPSPIALASLHSPHPAPTTTGGSSSAPPDWYQRLSQRLDTISLDFQQMSLDYQQMHCDHQEDMCEQAR